MLNIERNGALGRSAFLPAYGTSLLHETEGEGGCTTAQMHGWRERRGARSIPGRRRRRSQPLRTRRRTSTHRETAWSSGARDGHGSRRVHLHLYTHTHTHTATRRNGCNAAGARMWRMEKTRGSVGRGRDLLRQRTPHPIYEAALPPLHACASVLSTCRGEPAPAAAAAAAVCHGVCRRAAAHRFDAVRARRGEEISVPKSESAVTRGPPGARVTRTPASAEHMCASA